MIDQPVIQQAKNIRMLILDVDGVLTNGSIILDDQGVEYKTFHVRDGHGIKMLQAAGIKIVIITGRMSEVVNHRARELSIQDVYQGVSNKRIALDDIVEKSGIPYQAIACIGDDIVDIPLLQKVAFPIAVADATEETKAAATYITHAAGGRGAVREVCDLILKATGKWDQLLDAYRNS
jgi:3-deoxy-D-manno-octulosonate 8-phosphate phosphatase (KDO 8-P phosphatase)